NKKSLTCWHLLCCKRPPKKLKKLAHHLPVKLPPTLPHRFPWTSKSVTLSPSKKAHSNLCRPPFPRSKSKLANWLCWSRFSNAKPRDRKSTRLNSSHVSISYAVFCLKKKRSLVTKYSPTH